MKLARCKYKDRVFCAEIHGDCVRPLKGSLYEPPEHTGGELPLGEVRLLPVSEPGKILAVGFNYRDHAEEFDTPLPEWPNVFLKPNSALCGHRDPVVYPRTFVTRVDYEAELVAVIGKRARHVSREEAGGCLLGLTCGNDVSARNLQRPDGQWSVCKGFDTFAPVGPWVETGLDAAALDLGIEMRVNGEVRQRTNARHLIFDIPYLIEYLSHCMTLEPGDLIYTGTSSGVGPVQPGDEMEVWIEGVGSLVNPVVMEE